MIGADRSEFDEKPRHSENYDRWIANLKRATSSGAEGLLDAATDRGRDTKKMALALS